MQAQSFQVLVLGGRGFDLGALPVSCTRASGLEATFRLREPFRCVVLAPGACLPHAREIARELPARRRRVLVVSEDRRDLRAWRDRVACRWTPPADLARAVRKARRAWSDGRLRYPLAPASWLPAAARPSPRLRRALRRVAALPRAHEVGAWALACRMARSTLWRLCRTEAGLTPSEVLRRYVEAQVERGEERGLPWGDLASMLGYHDAATLRRAVARHRLAGSQM